MSIILHFVILILSEIILAIFICEEASCEAKCRKIQRSGTCLQVLLFNFCKCGSKIAGNGEDDYDDGNGMTGRCGGSDCDDICTLKNRELTCYKKNNALVCPCGANKEEQKCDANKCKSICNKANMEAYCYLGVSQSYCSCEHEKRQGQCRNCKKPDNNNYPDDGDDDYDDDYDNTGDVYEPDPSRDTYEPPRNTRRPSGGKPGKPGKPSKPKSKPPRNKDQYPDDERPSRKTGCDAEKCEQKCKRKSKQGFCRASVDENSVCDCRSPVSRYIKEEKEKKEERTVYEKYETFDAAEECSPAACTKQCSEFKLQGKCKKEKSECSCGDIFNVVESPEEYDLRYSRNRQPENCIEQSCRSICSSLGLVGHCKMDEMGIACHCNYADQDFNIGRNNDCNDNECNRLCRNVGYTRTSKCEIHLGNPMCRCDLGTIIPFAY